MRSKEPKDRDPALDGDGIVATEIAAMRAELADMKQLLKEVLFRRNSQP
jgi:hypothetical protein